MTDYETDPRPFADCCKAFALAINGGNAYGSRPRAASELRVPQTTFNNWLDGRPCQHEQAFRRLMTMVTQSPPTDCASSETATPP